MARDARCSTLKTGIISLEGLTPLKPTLPSTLVSAAFLLLAFAPSARAQKMTAANAQPATLEDRRKALNDLFHDYWEDRLKHDPEFASSIGDKRYNDQISDYSREGRQRRAGARAELSDAAGGHRSHRIHRPGKDQPANCCCAV